MSDGRIYRCGTEALVSDTVQWGQVGGLMGRVDAQTMVDQLKIQRKRGAVRIRSAAPPTAMQAVTVANCSWKKLNKRAGILDVATDGWPRTPFRPKLFRLPIKDEPPSANVSE